MFTKLQLPLLYWSFKSRVPAANNNYLCNILHDISV